MRVLFSHINYPAQFRRLAPALVAEGHDVVFICRQREWHAPPADDGLRLIHYDVSRPGGSAVVHPYLRRMEQAVIEGQAAYRAAAALASSGWQPDCIVNHVGYGNGLFLGDAFPQARRIGLFEWYYNAFGSDVDFLHLGSVDLDLRLKLRIWNAQLLVELAACDQAVVPTQWQRNQFPKALQHRLAVIHEGVDVVHLSQLDRLNLPRPSCLPPDPNLEVLTYVSRCFEEYRGFPQAMRAIARLQQRRPRLHVLIAGHDGVAYGATRNDGRSWGEWARHEVPIDPARTHWLGMLQDQAYWQVLAHSTVHLYLTVPFVLSWSLLEAAAAGCALVASTTGPVLEVLEHGVSALLVDFFDPEAQASAISTLLDSAGMRHELSRGAQAVARRYSAEKGLVSWRRLIAADADPAGDALCQGPLT